MILNAQSLQQHIAEFSSALTDLTVDEKESFIKKIKYSSKISSRLAIEIYKNNTRGARINALIVVYPACRNILGKEVFHSIAKAFVDADVTGSQNLNNYGAKFGQHLSSLLDAGRLPVEFNYLPYLARLEDRVHAAYYANDDPVFDFKLFEDYIKKGSQVYFRLSESLALLAFKIPILEIWLNNHEATDSGVSSVPAITNIQHLLVHRKKNRPVVTKIKPSEYKLLDEFKNKHSLQAAINAVDCDIEKVLPKLIEKKWICGIS